MSVLERFGRRVVLGITMLILTSRSILSIRAFVPRSTSTMARSAFLATSSSTAISLKGSSSSSSSSSTTTTTTTTTTAKSLLNSNAWKEELSKEELQEMLQTAEKAALAAGCIIRNHLGCLSEVCDEDDEECEIKTSIKDIVTQYDKQAQVAVEDIVRAKYPSHAFLGEENVDPGSAASEAALLEFMSEDFLWICDPIDGTANFASGLSLCAVTMSVVYKGTPVIGVVYDPHQNEMFSAIRGNGATVKQYKNHDTAEDAVVLREDKLRAARAVQSVQDAIINAGCPADPNAFNASMRGVLALNGKSRGIRVIACSALTTAWIAAGRLTAHFGYDLSSWDLVAGALLIHEAGGLVTDLDGTPYQLTTRSMLCSNGNERVHSEILEILEEADAVTFSRAE